MARNNLSKKIRFEVFKRDSFRCQYCGASAPEVLLEIDHVKPVSKGGLDDILNLLTACKPCNSGKSDRPLSDQSALAKQREQLEELNERRNQLELMIQWKEQLSSLTDDTLEYLASRWSNVVPGYSLNDHGRRELRKHVRTFSMSEVYDAMQTAADVYVKFEGDVPTQPSVNLAWSKIAGICRTTRAEKSKPYLRDLYYIRGILRNRVHVDERYIMELLENAATAGADIEGLKSLAASCGSWTDFRDAVEDYIARNKTPGSGA